MRAERLPGRDTAQSHRGAARVAPRLAGGMAAALALRVVAGLAAAAVAALLLEHYGLAGPPSPLPQPRAPRRPHPAPGPGDGNIFWGLQVTAVGVGAARAGRASPSRGWWWGDPRLVGLGWG